MFGLVAICFVQLSCKLFAISNAQITRFGRESAQPQHDSFLDRNKEIFDGIVSNSLPFQSAGKTVRKTVSHPPSSGVGDDFFLSKRGHTQNDKQFRKHSNRNYRKKKNYDHLPTFRHVEDFVLSSVFDKRGHTQNEQLWNYRTRHDKRKNQYSSKPLLTQFGPEFLLSNAVTKRSQTKNKPFFKLKVPQSRKRNKCQPPTTRFGRVFVLTDAETKRGQTENEPFWKKKNRNSKKKENIQQPPTTRFGRRVFLLCNAVTKRSQNQNKPLWKQRKRDYGKELKSTVTPPFSRYGRLFLRSNAIIKRGTTKNKPFWKHNCKSPDYGKAGNIATRASLFSRCGREFILRYNAFTMRGITKNDPFRKHKNPDYKIYNKGFSRKQTTYDHAEHPDRSNSKLPSRYSQDAKARKHVLVPRHRLASFNIVAPRMSPTLATNTRGRVNSREVFDFIENEELEALVDELQWTSRGMLNKNRHLFIFYSWKLKNRHTLFLLLEILCPWLDYKPKTEVYCI